MRYSCYSRDIIQNLTFSGIIGVLKHRLPQTCPIRRTQLHLLEAKGCAGCQKPIHLTYEETKKGAEISFVFYNDCQEWKKKYPAYGFQHHAFFTHDEKMQIWINRYKFTGDIRLTGISAYKWTWIKKDYPTYIYCPIPLSEKGRLGRGLDQVGEMLKTAKIPFQMLLKGEQYLLVQAKSMRKERSEMPQPSELVVPLSKTQHKKILIIDDVYMAGQTLSYTADCLQTVQPKTIRTISLAR